MAEKKNETLKKAREEMNYLTGDAAIRRLAELREKWDMDYESGIDFARKEAKEENAKKLLELGVGIEKIIKATGLTKEQIENLK